MTATQNLAAGLAVLDAAGIGISAARILLKLDHHGATPMTELATHLGCHTANITNLCDRLEKMNLAGRIRFPEDRRMIHLTLLPAGRALLSRLP